MIRCIREEGMPTYRNPFQKGNLFVKFKIEFPVDKFTSTPNLEKLEKLLPKRQRHEIPTGENVMEVDLTEYDPSRSHGSNGEYFYIVTFLVTMCFDVIN